MAEFVPTSCQSGHCPFLNGDSLSGESLSGETLNEHSLLRTLRSQQDSRGGFQQDSQQRSQGDFQPDFQRHSRLDSRQGSQRPSDGLHLRHRPLHPGAQAPSHCASRRQTARCPPGPSASRRLSGSRSALTGCHCRCVGCVARLRCRLQIAPIMAELGLDVFVFLYSLFLYCFVVLLCNLAQEFPSG